MHVSNPLRVWILGFHDLGLSHNRERGTDMSYLTKMTVAELKTVADRMAVPYAARIKKADLVAAIVAGIETDHVRAIEDDNYLSTYVCTVCGDTVKILDQPEHMTTKHTFKGMTSTNRMGVYKRQNAAQGAKGIVGEGKFTSRQNRRILKKFRKGLKSFPLSEVVGS
jgi:hypothetical protein